MLRDGNEQEGERTMTTYNHLANSQYIAAYQAEIASDLRNAGWSKGLLDTLRDRAGRSRIRSRARLWFGKGIEADTRQIRNFDHSRSSGACEVVQGVRLAT
jgi:hypothetical protein